MCALVYGCLCVRVFFFCIDNEIMKTGSEYQESLTSSQETSPWGYSLTVCNKRSSILGISLSVCLNGNRFKNKDDKFKALFGKAFLINLYIDANI